jgi:hypothetical protein
MVTTPIEILFVWEGRHGRLDESQRQEFLKNKIVKSLTQFDINLIQDAVLADRLLLKDILRFVKENADSFAKAEPESRITEVGAYLYAGTVYSVRRDRRAQEWQIWFYEESRKKYKRLDNSEKEKVLLRKLTPKSRLTLNKATKYSLETGVCCHCGRRLSALKSVVQGMGPVCKTFYR